MIRMSLYEPKTYVLFTKLPLPPSSNHQYTLARRGQKTYHVASAHLKAFQREMNQYPQTCRDLFLCNQQAIHGWIKEGKALEIRCFFFFKRERLFTKKSVPKKLDVSNRIKALHDCLCRILEIDDSLFFRVIAEKAPCAVGLQEMTCVEILPC